MRRLISAIAIVAVCAACGKSEEQKQAEQAAENVKKAAETLAKAAEQQGTATAAKGANDLASAMQGMAASITGAATNNNGKPVDPVAFQTLQSHLPKVSGWEMGEPEGERMTMPATAASSAGCFGQTFPVSKPGAATAMTWTRASSRATTPGVNSKPPPMAAAKPSPIRSTARLARCQSGSTAG